MKVTLDREGKNIVRLGLELEADKALKVYEQSCRKLSHRLAIPGFRKGKAPRNIIEKAIGVDAIKREALEAVANEYLLQAISDEKLDAITFPEVYSYEFQVGENLTLKAKFEVRPEVKLGEYLGISVIVPKAELPEDSVEAALKNIADSKSTLKPIPNRKIEMGDTVLLDFECFVDDKIVEGGKAEGLVLEVKEGGFLDGFCEQLVGKEPDTKTEIKTKFPEDYRNKELAKKDAVFKVELREIRQRITPEINDELATSMGQESLAKLKEALTSRFMEEIEQENEIRSQRAIVEAVVQVAEVDIPETMVERECELLLQNLRKYYEQNNQSWDAIERSPEFETIKKSKYEEAQSRVRTSLVLGAIVKKENITVHDEELTPYIAEVIARYNLPANEAYRNEELRRQVIEEMLTGKVVEHLAGKAKIEYIKEEPHTHSENCEHEQGHEHGKDKKAAKVEKEQEKDQAVAAGASQSATS